jgi:hypothetical protein
MRLVRHASNGGSSVFLAGLTLPASRGEHGRSTVLLLQQVPDMVTSLRSSFAPLLAPLLRAFPSLKPEGGPSLVPAICCAIGTNFKTHFSHSVSLGRKILLRGGCGFCKTLPESAEESAGFSLFSESVP